MLDFSQIFMDIYELVNMQWISGYKICNQHLQYLQCLFLDLFPLIVWIDNVKVNLIFILLEQDITNF